MRALALLATAAACGDSRVVLELAGDVPRADRVDVLLLEPVVFAKKQVHNRDVATTPDRLETVFYMAERSRTTIGSIATTQGLQLEIQGAGGPYVPLVAVQAGEQLLALGIYNPQSIFAAPLGREHPAAAVAPVGDVTIYPIELEPVAGFRIATPGAELVRPGEVMAVPCGSSAVLSGFAWRRADQLQLRVLAALPRDKDVDRLDPPDLDCDQHSPGAVGLARHVPGDELDCDDTASAIHAEAREQCSQKVDEDCNLQTTLSPAASCTGPCPSQRCVCDDLGEAAACLEPLYGQPCRLHATSGQPCDSAGPLPLPLICQAGCQVLLGWAPEGLEVTLSDNPGQMGQPLGQWVPVPDRSAFLTVRATGRPISNTLEIIVRIKAGVTITNHVISLALQEASCGAPSPLECPGG